MTVIIAGSRSLPVTTADIDRAVQHSGFHVTTVVSGHGGNVDLAAEEWAQERDIPVLTFPAQWATYGKPAGPRRNVVMAQRADALIAIFAKDRYATSGTANMIQAAENAHLHIWIERT